MDKNGVLSDNSAGSSKRFNRESVLDDGFCLEECRAAAEAGDAGAQGVLGDCYQYGWYVEKDYATAVAWYEKASAQGNAEAQRSLGWCWSQGNGVGPSDEKAVYWYTKAAEGGDADAQHNLGVCYDYGNGVEQDRAKGSDMV